MHFVHQIFSVADKRQIMERSIILSVVCATHSFSPDGRTMEVFGIVQDESHISKPCAQGSENPRRKSASKERSVRSTRRSVSTEKDDGDFSNNSSLYHMTLSETK